MTEAALRRLAEAALGQRASILALPRLFLFVCLFFEI
jgi:hypothetical protein